MLKQENANNPDQNESVVQHVKSMLGPFPEEADKPVAEKSNNEADIPVQNEPPGAPPVGSVIVPTVPTEPEEPEDEPNELPLKDEETPKLTSPEPVAKEPTKALPIKSGSKVRRFFRVWWHNKPARYATIVGLIAIFAGITLYPNTRYFVLNNAGVRSSASITVLDDTTQLPLKNVKVTLADASGQTNSDGEVKLEHLKLGKARLTISKRAFADLSKNLTIGWGSNPLGNFSIKAVGTQYTFTITDFLSSKPIAKAEATSGDASALSDDNGKIVLTIDPSEVNADVSAKITADEYRTEQVALGTDTTTNNEVKMVPARKEVYISNRSGKYDLYASDIDGKNEKLVLAGTGLERSDIVLVPHPTDEEAALVSSRVNIRNSDGYLLDTLTVVSLKDNSNFTVAQSERIQVVGWVGQKLLFVQIAAGASAGNPGRFRLMSYDYKNADKKELARANSFNDILLIGDSVYYAPSSAYQTDPVGLMKISADGSNKKTLLDKEVWNIFRDSYDTLDLAVGQDWYQYKLGDSNALKVNQAPSNPKSRIYISSPDGKNNLWVDQRDGKGVLLNRASSSSTDKTLQTQSGLVYPVRWLTNSVLIYRVKTDSETADYAMSLDGGKAQKIKDVYNAAGIDRWYYY